MPTVPNIKKMNTYRGRDYTPEIKEALSHLKMPFDPVFTKKEIKEYGRELRAKIRAEMKIHGVPEPLAKRITRPTK